MDCSQLKEHEIEFIRLSARAVYNNSWRTGSFREVGEAHRHCWCNIWAGRILTCHNHQKNNLLVVQRTMVMRSSLMKARSDEGSCRVPAATPAARCSATDARHASASCRSSPASLAPRSLCRSPVCQPLQQRQLCVSSACVSLRRQLLVTATDRVNRGIPLQPGKQYATQTYILSQTYIRLYISPSMPNKKSHAEQQNGLVRHSRARPT